MRNGVLLTGRQVMEQYDLSELDLRLAIKDRKLPVYNKLGKQIFPPELLPEDVSMESLLDMVNKDRTYPGTGPIEDDADDFCFYYEDVDTLASQQTSDAIIEKKVFPCDPGTKWRDVEITLTSYEYVKIKTSQGEDSYHFKEVKILASGDGYANTDLEFVAGSFSQCIEIVKRIDEYHEKNLKSYGKNSPAFAVQPII